MNIEIKKSLQKTFGEFEIFIHHPFKNLYKVINWQLHWRLFPNKPFLMKFYNNLTIQLASSGVSFELYLNEKFSDPFIADLFSEFLKSGMVVFDCGAHIGEFTLLFSSLVGTSGTVHCFEPDYRVFKILEENIKLNNLQNVLINNAALSGSTGIKQFVKHSSDPTQSLLYEVENFGDDPSKLEGSEIVYVQSITINDYVRSNRITKLDALKIDVEGAENGLISEARWVFSELKPKLLFIECHIPGEVPDLIRILNKTGYRIEIREEKFQTFPFLIARM